MKKYLGQTGLTILWNKIKTIFNNKVDKVEGKQLSTEDFTTLLKTKLEGLTNYDDTELQTKIDALKVRLDTILDSENTTTVIDTFQEIEAFLQGVTNTETLTGLLQEMKSEIVAMIPSNYVTTDTNQTITGNKKFNSPIKIYPNVESGIQDGILLHDSSTGIGEGLRITWTSADFTNKVILYGDPSRSMLRCVGLFTADGFKTLKGTSSQFLKADGSVDSTSYLPTSGGTITSISDRAIKLNTSDANAWSSISFVGDDNYLGYNKSNAVFFVSKPLTIGSLNNTVWHKGNDGAGSGLDADLLDGKHDGELTASYFNPITLDSSVNLNYTDNGVFQWIDDENPINSYCKNSICFCLANNRNEKIQIAYGYNSPYLVCRTGNKTSNFTPWRKFAFTDSTVVNSEKLQGYIIGENNGNIVRYSPFPSADQLVTDGYIEEVNKQNTEHYLKGVCKWISANFSNGGMFQGAVFPNARGFVQIYCYPNNNNLNSEGLSNNISGIYVARSGSISSFGTIEGVWRYNNIVNNGGHINTLSDSNGTFFNRQKLEALEARIATLESSAS